MKIRGIMITTSLVGVGTLFVVVLLFQLSRRQKQREECDRVQKGFDELTNGMSADQVRAILGPEGDYRVDRGAAAGQCQPLMPFVEPDYSNLINRALIEKE